MKELIITIYRKLLSFLKRANKIRHRIFRGSNLYFAVFIYFAIIMAAMIIYGQWLSPDRFIILGLVLALIVANPVNYIKDWAPFILLLLSYEFMRGLVPHLNNHVNIFPLINADKFLFAGHLPTIELQKWLYVPGKLHFYDFVLAVLYIMHFALPLIVGFILWIKKREKFRNFSIALIALSYLGFATYLLYPAMPPWMASEQHLIPHVFRIFDAAAAHFFRGGSLPSVYWLFGPNQVAAMPSLHAAYPMLVFLYMVKNFGRKWLFFFLYVLGVWFAVVYMGEHYVIDVIVGAAYAIIIYLAVEFVLARIDKKIGSKEKISEKASEPVQV